MATNTMITMKFFTILLRHIRLGIIVHWILMLLVVNASSSYAETVTTNVGGWRVELDVLKSGYEIGKPVTVRLGIQNATQQQREFAYLRGGIWAMGVGNYEVTSVKTGQPVKGPLNEDQIHDTYAGALHPLLPNGRKDFNNDLMEGFAIEKPGSYRVRFHAKLPATTVLKGPTIEFTTPWVQFEVAEKSASMATNAPASKTETSPVRR